MSPIRVMDDFGSQSGAPATARDQPLSVEALKVVRAQIGRDTTLDHFTVIGPTKFESALYWNETEKLPFQCLVMFVDLKTRYAFKCSLKTGRVEFQLSLIFRNLECGFGLVEQADESLERFENSYVELGKSRLEETSVIGCDFAEKIANSVHRPLCCCFEHFRLLFDVFFENKTK